MKKKTNLKSLLMSLLALGFVFSLTFTSCGGKKESESNEDATEHPMDEAESSEHPSSGDEHPSGGEHPSSDSTEHPSN
ncbi:hypothetical protein [Algoriphagus sp. CAU 1675]|uniref:hypothetical protein n=1 Tax=Algoriphagus sp. CAU 1675 TaxID=3032597 RepID=UPI0023DC2A49|nr:hypothetical protein [Algoriphagus sp. CAU 1675]MDF2157864.1 hypothetical protein [Algoriphagus sp. CAU 1675]